jgi:hypothetical protein
MDYMPDLRLICDLTEEANYLVPAGKLPRGPF